MNLRGLSSLLPLFLSKSLVVLLVIHTQIVFFIFSINNNIFFYPNHNWKSLRMTYKLNNNEKLMNLESLGLLLSSLLLNLLVVLLVGIYSNCLFYLFHQQRHLFLSQLQLLVTQNGLTEQ